MGLLTNYNNSWKAISLIEIIKNLGRGICPLKRIGEKEELDADYRRIRETSLKGKRRSITALEKVLINVKR